MDEPRLEGVCSHPTFPKGPQEGKWQQVSNLTIPFLQQVLLGVHLWEEDKAPMAPVLGKMLSAGTFQGCLLCHSWVSEPTSAAASLSPIYRAAQTCGWISITLITAQAWLFDVSSILSHQAEASLGLYSLRQLQQLVHLVLLYECLWVRCMTPMQRMSFLPWELWMLISGSVGLLLCFVSPFSDCVNLGCFHRITSVIRNFLQCSLNIIDVINILWHCQWQMMSLIRLQSNMARRAL